MRSGLDAIRRTEMRNRFLLGVAFGVAVTVVVGGVLTQGPELLSATVAQAKKREKKPAANAPKTRLPNGRSLMPIKNGVYPRDYFPNTEKLGPNEMRIVALGTGMPQVIQKKTKASGWYVELGNGEKFLFDLGTGSMENLAALQPDWSQVDTVFLSHLHSDHAGDFAPLYIGGWMNGRYTPLYIYGPTSFPDAGGHAEAREFDYKKVQVVYDKNGVKVTQFPAIHALDGSVSYRMEWGKRSFVFGGDSAPNNWYLEHAKGAEVAVHECFYTPEGLADAMDIGMKEATYISSYVHTPPAAFGKIMSAVKPRLAVGYHIWPNPEYMNQTLDEVARTYDGEYVQATDLTVINVTDKQIVVREAVVSELALPTGTTKEYLEAYRSKVDANTKITEFLSRQRWKGFKPPPLPEK
jgi:ribonuclease Z